MRLHSLWRIILLSAIIIANKCYANLISSSEIRACARTSMNEEPMYPNGEKCNKKFVVSLAVQSGQVSSRALGLS